MDTTVWHLEYFFTFNKSLNTTQKIHPKCHTFLVLSVDFFYTDLLSCSYSSRYPLRCCDMGLIQTAAHCTLWQGGCWKFVTIRKDGCLFWRVFRGDQTVSSWAAQPLVVGSLKAGAGVRNHPSTCRSLLHWPEAQNHRRLRLAPHIIC